VIGKARVTDAQLDRYLTARRREVETGLSRTLPAKRGSPLGAAMRYAVLGGGKRLRPVLALAAAEAVGGPGSRRRALPFACALEMIHAYSLAHDDLPAMDDDDLRRGRPSLHVRFGEAIAILAGDALLTEAFAVMANGARRLDDADRTLAIVAEVAAAAGARGMVAGQVADIENEGKARVSLATITAIHRRKTGALIRAAVRAGAVAAGATPRELRALTTYGEAVGLAFQIADDILDETADVARLGKRRGGDRARGKATFPALLGLPAARESARQAGTRARRALTAFGSRAAVLDALAHRVVARAS
jgi:geranylgeranyl diphosphate synthase type II